MSKFQTFGCAAYVYCPKETRPNKQAPRSEVMIFIGYTQGMNAYRFMRTHNNSIATSSNAIFDERWFPRCSTSKPTVDVNNNDFEEDSEPSGSAPDDNVEDDDPDFPPPPNPPAPIEPQNDEENGEGDEEVRGGGEVPDQHGADQGGAGAIQPPPNPFNPVMEPEPAPIVRRSERARVPTQRPGNIYGDTPPAEIDRNAGRSRNIGSDIRWNRQIYGDQPEAGPSRQRQPAQQQPRANNPVPDPPVNKYSGESMNGRGSVDYISQLAHEGGVAFLDYLLSQAPENKETVRNWQFRDLMRLPVKDRQPWLDKCKEEIDSLVKRKVFEIVDRPNNRNVIKNRWVFDIKSDGRKRSRLVARGYSQVEGVDYDELFSPVVRYETVRVLLALAALEDWELEALDVKTAFLYGKLDEEIYMEQPEGFVKDSSKVWRLRRSQNLAAILDEA